VGVGGTVGVGVAGTDGTTTGGAAGARAYRPYWAATGAFVWKSPSAASTNCGSTCRLPLLSSSPTRPDWRTPGEPHPMFARTSFPDPVKPDPVTLAFPAAGKTMMLCSIRFSIADPASTTFEFPRFAYIVL
jgi:hypothetical protein